MASESFYVDAAIFDMDGTLTDSIAAVEAAWHKVAKDIGQDPRHVIAATHGKRAIDNLSQFMPHLKAHEMDNEVAKFEDTILFFADAYILHGPASERDSGSDSSLSTNSGFGTITPADSKSSSEMSEVDSSLAPPKVNSISFPSRLHHSLRTVANQLKSRKKNDSVFDRVDRKLIRNKISVAPDLQAGRDVLEAWQLEAAKVDRSVMILPGVRKLMDSIPENRRAVATSGAKTYAIGCMKRVGITPPQITITADDKRLKAGKPFPDPFLLAAKCLGYEASRCVVFEDSPSGIRAGVASGATVIAVCTSHQRSQIDNCGAHYIVRNLESVKCTVEGNSLKFTVNEEQT